MKRKKKVGHVYYVSDEFISSPKDNGGRLRILFDDGTAYWVSSHIKYWFPFPVWRSCFCPSRGLGSLKAIQQRASLYDRSNCLNSVYLGTWDFGDTFVGEK